MVTSIIPVNESDIPYLYFDIINFALKKRPIIITTAGTAISVFS